MKKSACKYSKLTINEKINLKGNLIAFGVKTNNLEKLVTGDLVTHTMVNANNY